MTRFHPAAPSRGDVVVDPDSSTPPPSESGDVQEPEDDVTVNPETPDANTNAGEENGADFTGTEQTIQGDSVKPEYTEEELKDPTKTPDGTPVEGTPEPQDHNNVTPPLNSPLPTPAAACLVSIMSPMQGKIRVNISMICTRTEIKSASWDKYQGKRHSFGCAFCFA